MIFWPLGSQCYDVARRRKVGAQTLFQEKRNQEAQRAIYRAPEYNVPHSWRIGQRGHFCLLIGPKNTNLIEDVEILLPVKFHRILSTRGCGCNFVFLTGAKTTNLVEDVEILLPVKFRRFLFSGFREEVENVSANQRPMERQINRNSNI